MGLTEGKSEWSRRSCYDDDIIPLTGRHKSTIATDMGDHSPSTLRRTRPCASTKTGDHVSAMGSEALPDQLLPGQGRKHSLAGVGQRTSCFRA